MAIITRQEYLRNQASHEDYYRQFVTPYVMSEVRRVIGLDQLVRSTDEHMNDIPLGQWDTIYGYSQLLPDLPLRTLGVSERLRAAGETVSAATMCCICKAAAKLLRCGSAADPS